jgi:hypothetical protein
VTTVSLRVEIEAQLDAIGWRWDRELSLQLDAAILAEEGGAR